jgi:membrane-associated phospholipid phosphatase
MRTTLLLAPLIVTLLSAMPAVAQTADPTPAPASTPPQQQTNVSPMPAHTGWRTLVKDTVLDFKAFPMRQSTWVLLGMGGAGALAGHAADSYVQEHIGGNDKADNFFALGQWAGSAYAIVGTSVALYGIGRYVIPPAADGSRSNKYSHLGFDLLRSQAVSQAFVHGIKYSVQRDRPTGECCAFPSGHAASAFAAAAVLERHLGYRGSWPALVGATYVATSRLVDNRHYLSDVIFGAALGEAAGWTVVGRHGRNSYVLQPMPVPGGWMVAVTRNGE